MSGQLIKGPAVRIGIFWEKLGNLDNSETFLFPFFFKRFARTPRGVYNPMRDSFCINLVPIRASLTDFVILFVVFENVQKSQKMIQQCYIFQVFPKAPAPRPHGTPPKRCASKFPATWTRFHPDWTKWHPIHAHFSFQISTCFNYPKKARLGTLGITWLGKGNLLFSFPICFLVGFDLKSISFPPPGDSQSAQTCFVRMVKKNVKNWNEKWAWMGCHLVQSGWNRVQVAGNFDAHLLGGVPWAWGLGLWEKLKHVSCSAICFDMFWHFWKNKT